MASTSTITDQAGRSLELPSRINRIVSTVPSQTELLYDLGLEKQVVGITAYCVAPPHWLREKKVIGGTKNLQIKAIRDLKPDLILGNKEENVREQIEDLSQDIPVWLSDVRDVDSALEMIEALGQMTSRQAQSQALQSKIQQERQLLQASSGLRSAFLIWKDPFMLAGPDTFIGQMMAELGLINLAPGQKSRYPEVSREELSSWDLDLLLLTSEPYAFNAGELQELAPMARQARIVDGAMFSWYGSRMAKAFPYLQALGKGIRHLEVTRSPS